jgi:hypothetical protein
MNFFNILNDILTKKNGNLHKEADFKKHASNYMLVRYLSMKDSLLPYAQILNKYQSVLNAEQMYLWAFKNIPRQNSGYIKYMSKKKKKKKTEKKSEKS